MRGIVPPGSYRFGRLAWDWDFGVDGALALEPRRGTRCRTSRPRLRVPRMPRASGHALARRTAGGRQPLRAGRGDWRGSCCSRLGRARHVAPDRFRVGPVERGPDRRRRRPATRLAAGRPAAPAGGRAAGSTPAPAAGRAEPRDGDRLPRRGRRRPRARPGRPAGEPGSRQRASRSSLFGSGTAGLRYYVLGGGAGPATGVARRRRGRPAPTSTRRSTARSSASPRTSSTASTTARGSTSSRSGNPSLVVSLTHLRRRPEPDRRLDGRRDHLEGRHGARLRRASSARRSRAYTGRGQPRRDRGAPRRHALESLKILFIADVFGAPGRAAVEERLPGPEGGARRRLLRRQRRERRRRRRAHAQPRRPAPRGRRRRDHARQPRLAAAARSARTSRRSDRVVRPANLASRAPGRGLAVVAGRRRDAGGRDQPPGLALHDHAGQPVRGRRRARRGGARAGAGRRRRLPRRGDEREGRARAAGSTAA